MKTTGKIVTGVGIVIAGILIAAAFGPDEYTIERTVMINKPVADVFSYIRVMKNQTHYSYWVMADPKSKVEFTGPDGQVGAAMAWDSEKMGKGTQTATKIDDNKRIDLDLHFMKPMEADANAYLTTDAVGAAQTKVVWGFHGKNNYVSKIFHLFISMDKMVGDPLQKGLDNLKGIMEKQ
jgi:uncharacterized protein YndB with AHSA1/START domain